MSKHQPFAVLTVLSGLFAAAGTGPAVPSVLAQGPDNPYATQQDVESGQRLFARHCSRCHGLNAGGGERGPDISTGEFQHASSDAGLFNVISNGIADTEMRGIYRTRSDQSVWQIVAWLRSLGAGARVAVAGDPAAGGAVYSGKGDCSRCHMIAGAGGRHGPDLTTIGNRRSPEQLRSDLVDPDARVQPQWWRVRATVRDGPVVEGLRMNEGTYSIRILDGADNLWSLAKRDLVASERIEASSMPSYADALTDSEILDLVAFLYNLTGSANGGGAR